MTNEIRSYGPGKFSTILDRYVYSASLDGCDEDIDDGAGLWYGLIRRGHTIFADRDPSIAELTDAEREYLTAQAGVIISEDPHGFVCAEYFTNAYALQAAWDDVLRAAATAEREDGGSS